MFSALRQSTLLCNPTVQSETYFVHYRGAQKLVKYRSPMNEYAFSLYLNLCFCLRTDITHRDGKGHNIKNTCFP